MAGNITVKLDVMKDLKKLSEPGVLQKIGDEIVQTVKEMIASGQSPVTGERFEPYKAVSQVRDLASEARRAGQLARIAGAEGDIKAANQHKQAQRDLKSISDETKKGYPYSVMDKYPDKTITPVNLYLSGAMLGYLRARAGANLEIGYIDAPSDIEVYAQAHNEGPTNGRFAQRKTIPTQQGEEFTESVMRKIKDLYSIALSDILEKSK